MDLCTKGITISFNTSFEVVSIIWYREGMVVEGMEETEEEEEELMEEEKVLEEGEEVRDTSWCKAVNKAEDTRSKEEEEKEGSSWP